MCAYSSTDRKSPKILRERKSIMCPMSFVTDQVSHVKCHVSCVTCHMSVVNSAFPSSFVGCHPGCDEVVQEGWDYLVKSVTIFSIRHRGDPSSTEQRCLWTKSFARHVQNIWELC